MDTMSFKRRVLATRLQNAKIHHRCDNCDECIFPGDRYELTVEVRIYGGHTLLWVRKEHAHAPCTFPPDDTEIHDKEYRDNVVPFKLAA
jgi:hypothetical protein